MELTLCLGWDHAPVVDGRATKELCTKSGDWVEMLEVPWKDLPQLEVAGRNSSAGATRIQLASTGLFVIPEV